MVRVQLALAAQADDQTLKVWPENAVEAVIVRLEKLLRQSVPEIERDLTDLRGGMVTYSNTIADNVVLKRPHP